MPRSPPHSAEAYRDCADYLGAAVAFGMLRCDPQVPRATAPKDIAERAAGASRRLDDTFRSYLAERGSKPVPLSAATRLVTGVVALRLAGDAVLNLWERDDGKAGGDRTAARGEVLRAAGTVTRWFTEFGESFARGGILPDPLPYDPSADQRLVEAVQHDLTGDDGRANATAVRMIWTEDHLDAARRLQSAVAETARVALDNRANETLSHLFSRRLHRPNPAAREIPTAEAAGTASR